MRLTYKKAIDLSKLPKLYNRIQWPQTVGYVVNFYYGDVSGNIEIIDFDIKTKYLKLKYLESVFHMSTSDFRYCRLGFKANGINNNFKFDINTQFINENRNMTIIDKEYRKSGSVTHKYYKYHCNICGWNDGWLSESSLKNGGGCGCCAKQTTVTNINDINTTHPELMKFIYNKNDGLTHTSGSKHSIDVICDNCKHVFNYPIRQLVKLGRVPCPKCCDNLSYPNKFIYNTLLQLDIDFENEKSFEWSNGRRYDFYIPSINCIIEANGVQHYRNVDGFRYTYEEIHKIDIEKHNFAINNGIENYIEIDCRKSNKEFISKNILDSNLSNLLNLDNINWCQCDKFCNKSIMYEVCKYSYENNNTSALELSKHFKIGKGLIISYLKRGSDIWDWVQYDPKIEQEKVYDKLSFKIEIFKDDKSLGVFKSITHLSNISFEKFGIKFGVHALIKAYRNNSIYNGYTFKIVK